MTEQELLNMFIQERINMLIDIFHPKQPDQSKKEFERILNAEIFIENLPNKEKELVQNYIDSLIRQFALEETFIYKKLKEYIGKTLLYSFNEASANITNKKLMLILINLSLWVLLY